MLCDFEPVKYCNAAPRLSAGTSRRSTWTPPRRRMLDFVSPRAEHTFDEAVLDEHVHDRRIRAGRQDVDVAARLAAAPEAADRRDRRGGKTLLEEGHDRAGDVVGRRQQMPAGVTLPLFDRLQDQRFFLGAHPLDGPNAAVERGALRDRRVSGRRAHDAASRPSSGRHPGAASFRESMAGIRPANRDETGSRPSSRSRGSCRRGLSRYPGSL